MKCWNTDCPYLKKSLGIWLRRPREFDNTVRAWLVDNDALLMEARPAKMTVNLYNSKIEVVKRKVGPVPSAEIAVQPDASKKRHQIHEEDKLPLQPAKLWKKLFQI